MAEPRAPKLAFEALTYDDVPLLPAYSEVPLRACDPGTRLTPPIQLHLPLLSAAVGTVTESGMAIAMAQEGGLGIIHESRPRQAQADQARRAKRSELALIRDPFTLPPTATLAGR